MKTNDKIQDLIRGTIKRLIKEKGLTIAELAARMEPGISGPALSQVLNGNPTIEMLDRIAIALGVGIQDFFNSPNNEIWGVIEYKGKFHKVDNVERLKSILSDIEKA